MGLFAIVNLAGGSFRYQDIAINLSSLHGILSLRDVDGPSGYPGTLARIQLHRYLSAFGCMVLVYHAYRQVFGHATAHQ